jgi:glutamyl-tRNA reductase
LFIVDLAVPRDVEKEVKELRDVFLYTVDDLSEVVRDGLDARQGAVKEAEVIIDSGVNEFIHWMESREVVPTIRTLRDHSERQRRSEMEKALRQLAKGDAPEKVLEALSNALTNKFLHAPTQSLNQAQANEREALLEAVHRIYNLHTPE